MEKQILNQAVRATVASFQGSFDHNWIARAQETKSASRNAMFGILMNEPFIEVTVKKETKLVSLVDYFGEEDAKSIVSLVIWNLANPSGYIRPTVARI